MAVFLVSERKLKQEKGAERYTSIRPLATSPAIPAMPAMASRVRPVEDKKLDARCSATRTPSTLNQSWFEYNVGKQKSFIGNLYFSFDVHPSHLHKCEEVKMQSEESQITEVFTAAVAED